MLCWSAASDLGCLLNFERPTTRNDDFQFDLTRLARAIKRKALDNRIRLWHMAYGGTFSYATLQTDVLHRANGLNDHFLFFTIISTISTSSVIN